MGAISPLIVTLTSDNIVGSGMDLAISPSGFVSARLLPKIETKPPGLIDEPARKVPPFATPSLAITGVVNDDGGGGQPCGAPAGVTAIISNM